MTPDFKVVAAGVNITPQIRDRLLSLTVTDEAGLKSDSVEITLDDRDGLIELPAPGAPMLVFLGYRETGLIPMGLFTFDEVTVTSPPATLTIRAKAADLGGSIKDQKTRSWDNMTIGDIIATIANEHGLTPKVAERFQPVLIEHIDQTEESDIGFLDRMGRDHDALVSVKGGRFCSWARAAPPAACRSRWPPHRWQAARNACYRTTSTGIWVPARTSAVWLPSNSLVNPRRPREPMTTRSQPDAPAL